MNTTLHAQLRNPRYLLSGALIGPAVSTLPCFVRPRRGDYFIDTRWGERPSSRAIISTRYTHPQVAPLLYDLGAIVWHLTHSIIVDQLLKTQILMALCACVNFYLFLGYPWFLDG